MVKRFLLASLLLWAGGAMAQSGPGLVAVGANGVISVLGRRVVDPSGDEIGRIVDLLVDKSGVARGAVIDAGGFMGIGARRVAVAWETLHFTVNGDGEVRISEDLSVDTVSAAPEYKGADQPVQMLGPKKP